MSKLFDNFSLEMTAKDIVQLEATAALIPMGTTISVTFLPGETFSSRIDAAAKVQELGMKPVPHISARRINSHGELEGFLDALADRIELKHVFVVAGDLAQPAGPFEDALSIIKSGLLKKYGVEHVGISGYPESHPDINKEKLQNALVAKDEELRSQGLDYSIMTQFGFDGEPILKWLKEIRAIGIDAPVRIGVAGPANIATLLRFAARCGVGASSSVMKKYGVSLTKLVGSAGPEPIIKELDKGIVENIHGKNMLHFYPFGGLTKTAQWIKDYTTEKVST